MKVDYRIFYNRLANQSTPLPYTHDALLLTQAPPSLGYYLPTCRAKQLSVCSYSSSVCCIGCYVVLELSMIDRLSLDNCYKEFPFIFIAICTKRQFLFLFLLSFLSFHMQSVFNMSNIKIEKFFPSS